MNSRMSRRNFVKTTVLSMAGFTIIPRHVMGGPQFTPPSDQINLGIIGCGAQSRWTLAPEFAKRANIIAACDCESRQLEEMENIIQKINTETKGQANKGFKKYKHYRDLLKRKDIDGVIIGTPDHWHAVMTIEACRAGKDVYVEKPMAHSIEEGRAMVNAVEKYNRVLQVGNMQRSWRNFRQACELVRNGYIGDIKEILVSVGPPPKKFDLKEQPVPKTLDWDLWVGPAEMRPYNEELAPPMERKVFPNWRNYAEYGGGMVCDWGTHMFDIAQWAMDMDKSGPVQFIPADGKEFKHTTLIYDNGVIMRHVPSFRTDDGNGVRFIGTNGVIDISRSFLDTIPAKLADMKIGDDKIKLYRSDDHYSDFLQAMKSRKQPISNVEMGHRSVSLCHILNICYDLNRKLQWNPATESFVNDDEANKRRSIICRKPYSLEI